MTSNFFEDFCVGQHFRHATPRTVSEGDASLYIALTGSRQPIASSREFALRLGYESRPAEDLLLFNMAFGKTVPDISANAIANLGYADVRFVAPLYLGDTLSAESEVIGLREVSSGRAGIVYVRSNAYDQRGRLLLTWIRWVLVAKSAPDTRRAVELVPELPSHVPATALTVVPSKISAKEVAAVTGGTRLWDDYAAGDRIDHSFGMTLDETDHVMATRLYQNSANVHFDAVAMAKTSHGRRLVYGGHVISVCHALSRHGLENALAILAINAGSHVAPTFAGDTLYAYSEVIERISLPGRNDVAALRLRLVGLRNMPASAALAVREDSDPSPTVLDLDYTVAMPRRR